jgi:dynein heavy chain
VDPLDVDKADGSLVGSVMEKVNQYRAAKAGIEATSASLMKYPMFEVHCAEIIDKLTKRADELAKRVLDKVNESAETRTKELSEKWDFCQNTVRNAVQNEKELADLKEYMKDIQKVVDPQVATLKHIRLQLDLLENFTYEVRKELVEEVFDAAHWPLTIKVDVSARIREIDKEKIKFMEQLALDKEIFTKDMKKWQAKLEFVKNEMTAFEDAKNYDKDVSGFHDQLMEGRRRIEDFNQRESLFGIELTEREELEELIEDYEPYFRMWSTAIEFTYNQESWLSMQLTQLPADDVFTNVDQWYKSAYKMVKTFAENPVQKAVVESLCKAIKKFKENVPIIEALCHPAIQPRHWFELFDEMEVDAEGELGELTMSLTQLLELNIHNYISKLEEISAGAQKEYGLRKSLAGMKDEWRPLAFETVPWKETGTYLLKGIDEVQAMLDDHIVKTQAIRGSPFCKPFEKECREWEQKLIYIQDAMDQILTCQRNWLYLEPIFTAEDIMRQMPGETQKFKQVDSRWRDTMGAVYENPGVLDFAEIENLLINFQDANKLLDVIQKGLNDYLETKRLYFPRFFFLSNDELLSILSETKDPTRVQPHMNKAFEAIAKVRFDAKDEIIEAMVSGEGEVVEFFQKVNVMAGDNKGNVEKWLKQVESSMQMALRTITDKSVAAYAETERTKWVIEWPGQVVICVDMVYFSMEVAEALDAGEIVKYMDKLQHQLTGIVGLVRGELTKLARKTMAALTTIDVHNRDVVADDLVKRGINDSEDFAWLAQLRYYWAKPGTITVRNTGKINDMVECEVKIVNSCLLYAFEYLGNSDRLVITPLTDRCYRTLMGAFHLYYGGAPEGPAGTGKTESTKDLAKALAIQCVVFNCSDGLDFLAMSKFFKGLAASGAWCCFDEFNRINVEVLSVIAAQVMVIQFAIREKKKRFLFEGTELNLVPSCAVNITMNPGYAGRAELPDNLKALFRPCAMMVPNYALIGEIFLYSYGFEAAKDIGRKATVALRLSSEQLSPQDHYDFGMRGLKSLLVASGALKRKYGDSLPEPTLALRAFLDVNQPKFTAGDMPLFDGIVGDLFPGVTLPPSDNDVLEAAITEATEQLGLQATQNHITKSIQLWETILVRHGLMTVGLPPCGKTSINDTLAITLEKLQDGNLFMPVTKYKVNPKSITQGQLYGSFDENTHEWADGVLAVAVRTAAMAGEERRQWLILDGPVDAIWIEDMNTVLDDNKKLCLLSGEIIKLSSVTNMLFEVADLQVASPATVSRCGMVFMEPQNLGWHPMVMSWMQKQPEHILKFSEQILELFDANCGVTYEVLRTQKLPIPSPPSQMGLDNWLMYSLARLLQALMSTHCPADGKKALSAKDMELRIDHLFYFALLWTVGVATDEVGRAKMDQCVRDLIQPPEEGVLEKYGLVGIADWHLVPNKQTLPDPDKGLLYDFYIHEDTGKWTPWVSKLRQLEIPAGSQFHQIIVPTADTVRNQFCLEQYIEEGFHVIFSGITGTGKTVCVQNMLLHGFDKDSFSFIAFAFSAATTANQTQDIIDGKLDKKGRESTGLL